MPLQNRVDPFGTILAVSERGLFTGNRGIIHDPKTKTLLRKRWASKAWIICVCQFRNWRREPMGRNGRGGKAGWTELFFLNEVTALAAGHRPCFFCRREQATDFVARFGRAFDIEAPRAPMVDELLHKERVASGGHALAVSLPRLDNLPDGVVVADESKAYALRCGQGTPMVFRRLQQTHRFRPPCWSATAPVDARDYRCCATPRLRTHLASIRRYRTPAVASWLTWPRAPTPGVPRS